jgi:hypothetical protein
MSNFFDAKTLSPLANIKNWIVGFVKKRLLEKTNINEHQNNQ